MMEQHLSVLDEDFASVEMQRFLNIVEERNCRYYASDLFGGNAEQDLNSIDGMVQHALQIFKTLNISTEQHVQVVLRGTIHHDVFRDWKISELACLYMLINGDPNDLQTIAEQQHMFINELLHYVQPARVTRD